METKVGVGFSRLRNPEAAGREAVSAALAQAGVDKPDFVFLFATVGYDQEQLVRAVRQTAQGAPLCGCSAEGTIVGDNINETNFAAAVMTVCSDAFYFLNGLAEGFENKSRSAGRAVAKAIQPEMDETARGLFVLTDGLSIDNEKFLADFDGCIRKSTFLPLMGGAAADNWSQKRTYQYCNDKVVSNGIAWALLKGDARIAWSVNHSCVYLGIKHEVTRSEGNTIYEIDSRPALEIVKRYLPAGKEPNRLKILADLSFGMKAPTYLEGYDEFIIRYMLAKDDDQQSITVSSEISEGRRIWLMRRDVKKTADGADRINADIRTQLDGAIPKMVFQFDCAGRGKVFLREQQKIDILHQIQSNIHSPAWFGFYTLGEIGPVSGYNCFHNFSAVVAAIY